MSAWGDIPCSTHCESFKEWIDEGIEPVPAEEVPPDYSNQELGPE